MSSWCFLTRAKPEDTLTCKARRNNFPHRQFIFTDGGRTAHCTLTTTSGLQDWAVIVWDAQIWDLLYKLKVSNRKLELLFTAGQPRQQRNLLKRKTVSASIQKPTHACLGKPAWEIRREHSERKFLNTNTSIRPACKRKKKKTTN